MILYLDTSAYVRLYIREAAREVLLGAVGVATLIASHAIAYTEMRAALARMLRMHRLRKIEYTAVLKAYELDWSNTLQVMPAEALIRRAGDLAERFGLRGCDSVHLAAAESLAVAPSAVPVTFVAFDAALNAAAEALGLPTLGASEGQ